jgi:hypothetical protein
MFFVGRREEGPLFALPTPMKNSMYSMPSILLLASGNKIHQWWPPIIMGVQFLHL